MKIQSTERSGTLIYLQNSNSRQASNQTSEFSRRVAEVRQQVASRSGSSSKNSRLQRFKRPREAVVANRIKQRHLGVKRQWQHRVRQPINQKALRNISSLSLEEGLRELGKQYERLKATYPKQVAKEPLLKGQTFQDLSKWPSLGVAEMESYLAGDWETPPQAALSGIHLGVVLQRTLLVYNYIKELKGALSRDTYLLMAIDDGPLTRFLGDLLSWQSRCYVKEKEGL